MLSGSFVRLLMVTLVEGAVGCSERPLSGWITTLAGTEASPVGMR